MEEPHDLRRPSLFNDKVKQLKYAIKPSVEEIEVSSSVIGTEESKLPFSTRRMREIDISKP